jgi:phosphoglycerate dehydrogenase-like enzyme
MAQDGEVELIRTPLDSTASVGDLVPNPETVVRLVALRVPMGTACLEKFTALEELVLDGSEPDAELAAQLEKRGIRRYRQPTEGFWGQSVSEVALALTINGLRRIPQQHHEMISNLQPWNHKPENGVGVPGGRGQQFCDDPRFVNGTVEGKRVRIVGAGNIASRYASFMSMLGADVAAWDPFASEPCFHRAGARKEWYLDRLVRDADIFAPMVPLTERTKGLVTAEHIRALPKGALVVLVTRAGIVDMAELRRRVLADELSLAADVFDIEPLPLDDPLLGRHNVVHTPHIAGRTKEANFAFAAKLYEQFIPRT